MRKMRFLSIIMVICVLSLTTSCQEAPNDNEGVFANCDHKAIYVEETPHTCICDGIEGGYVCSLCDTILSGRNVIRATGHTPEIVYGYFPSYTNDGLTDGIICSVCKEALKQQATIPHTGYLLGEKMRSFTLVSLTNEKFTLSEILEDYDAVVLIFLDCESKINLPAFNSIAEAYNDYTDSIKILAINNNDSSERFSSYYQNDAIPLFLSMSGGNEYISPYTFGKQGYPTVIIIDRFSNVALTVEGGIVDQSLWSRAFSFYSNELYSEWVTDDINKIP